MEDVTKKRAEPSAEAAAAAELVRLAKEQGLSLTGPDGLLKQFTKTVLETALNEEMSEHLGHDKNQARPDRESTNIRNGTRSKTVLTEASGHVPIEVPRDREGTFEPQIVRKRQRRLNGVDEIVLSLYAKGLTTGEISAHFAEIYGASVSKGTISRITDKVLEEMQDWAARPLDEVRYRRAVKARGHFPSEAAALKCLYLVTRSLDPTGKGQARWITRWKPAPNAFAITFADRWPGSETY
ncbi:transposase [Rhodococcus qingshengii]|uniref:transposase n=1 Tax=Rhodococcus qingshengii TaxID=334542 RepID=UPI00355624ED